MSSDSKQPISSKNDNVVVITGKDRGKRGRVLQVLPDEEPRRSSRA